MDFRGAGILPAVLRLWERANRWPFLRQDKQDAGATGTRETFSNRAVDRGRSALCRKRGNEI